jgi:P4 family phage/plasmid primase-like protien
MLLSKKHVHLTYGGNQMHNYIYKDSNTNEELYFNEPDQAQINQNDEIQNIWNILNVSSNSVFEIRAIDKTGKNIPAVKIKRFRLDEYPNSTILKASFEQEVHALNKLGYNVYFIFNEIDPNPSNSITSATKDDDILSRQYLFIDIDRSSDTKSPASDIELNVLRQKTQELMLDLNNAGFPMPQVIMSGNGFHLYYPTAKIPADDRSKKIFEDFIKALGTAYNSQEIKIDPVIFNAARIGKVCGTKSIKDGSTAIRPNRISYIVDAQFCPAVAATTNKNLLTLQKLEDKASNIRMVLGGQANEAAAIKVEDKMVVDGAGNRVAKIQQPNLPTSPNDIELSKLKSALEFCDSNSGRGSGSFFDSEQNVNKDIWLAVIWAIASLNWHNGEEIARGWSMKSSSKYDHSGFDLAWKSYNPNHNNPITIASLYKYALQKGWKSDDHRKLIQELENMEFSDSDNVDIIYMNSGEDIKYVADEDIWICWDGNRWVRDAHQAKLKNSIIFIREYYKSRKNDLEKIISDNASDFDTKKKFIQFAAKFKLNSEKCGNHKTIESIKKLAEMDERFQIKSSEIDSDIFLLGVRNGVLDLRTGKLLSCSEKGKYVTRRIDIDFIPSAKAPIWENFISQITSTPSNIQNEKFSGNSRPDLAAFLQRVLGLSCTGDTSPQSIFFFTGVGANGKSVLLDVMKDILGDFSATLNPELLMKSNFRAGANQAEPALMQLKGARLAVASESKSGHVLDNATLKLLSGEQKLVGRQLYKSISEFRATHKLFLVTNELPNLSHVDQALISRLVVINFDMQWRRPADFQNIGKLPDADTNLIEKLKNEYSGILNWLVSGALDYQSNGLNPPSAVTDAVSEYINDKDPLTSWLSTLEECEIREGETAANLFQKFSRYCDQEGFDKNYTGITTAASLGKHLTRLKKKSKKLDGSMHYGLRSRINSSIIPRTTVAANSSIYSENVSSLFRYK